MSIMDGDLGDQIIASSVSDVTFASELDGLAARLSENGVFHFFHSMNIRSVGSAWPSASLTPLKSRRAALLQ
jgi:hypothetical protein